MTYKVIQWAPGYIGEKALKYIIKHPMLELVGVKVYSDAKEGLDAGELCGLAPMGIKATKDEGVLLAMDADCVVFNCGDTSLQNPYPGTMGYGFLETICRILESGKNVVSTTPMQMLNVRHMGEEGQKLVDMLNASCKKGNSTVTFSGFEPGFMGDTVPSIISSISTDVTRVRIYELVDWGNYDKFDTLLALGLGTNHDTATRQMIMNAFIDIWSTTINDLADLMNIKLDRITAWDEPVLADESFVAKGGMEIPKGTVAVNHWAIEGIVNDEPVIGIEHINRMRHDLAPELPSMEHGGYRVVIDSNELPITTDIKLGVGSSLSGVYDSFDTAMFGVAARSINTIEAVCKASPGYKTKEELPAITGRNTMWKWFTGA